MEKRAPKINFKLFSVIIIFLIIILVSILIKYYKDSDCRISENSVLNKDFQYYFKHNYVVFKSRQNNHEIKLVEINGWLLLEAIMKKSLDLPIDQNLNEIVKSFGTDSLVGWWPDELVQSSKSYLLSKEETKKYYDADDTAWIYRYNGRLINESTLKIFLSDKPLPGIFYEACKVINCGQNYIVRLWDPDWYNEDDNVNLIVMANFITMLDDGSNLSKKVFSSNKELINFIIENQEIEDYYEYFDPKSSGYFLLLFYDYQGPKFLTDAARNILFKKLNGAIHELSNTPISSTLVEDWNHNCVIIWYNEHILKLMEQYAKQHWNIYLDTID